MWRITLLWYYWLHIWCFLSNGVVYNHYIHICLFTDDVNHSRPIFSEIRVQTHFISGLNARLAEKSKPEVYAYIKGVAKLIKLTFNPSFKPLEAVVPMTQKTLLVWNMVEGVSKNLQLYIQTTLQTRGAYVKLLFTPERSRFKVNFTVV